ncbi:MULTISPECIES: hypothetical protein [Inquilinus]|uniref:Uncharacterized protein (DUF2062 family) n=1 Tax=Inquilinus ginsengisoli TaxID=363840 RepID=A0ABU1JMH3_9PROT|nr:hypothetical protein [Inquilinus ginsengisoli]MDR6289802.1 uncharacterized protein (DUF2062 family) [Inquilinus ginsengisoli]
MASSSRLTDPADGSSLACVCGVAATGLAAGLVAAFGPPGSDLAVAQALFVLPGAAAAVGLGFGLAMLLARR